MVVALIDPRELHTDPKAVKARLRELGMITETKHCSLIQQAFLVNFAEPFTLKINTETNEVSLAPRSVFAVAKALEIYYSTLYTWIETRPTFKKAFEKLKALREWAFVSMAEERLISNVNAQKEVSTIFYLKNRYSDRYRDDQVLNRIYLETKELNFNFIKTSVSGMGNAELVVQAKQLTEQLDKLTGKDVIDVSR